VQGAIIALSHQPVQTDNEPWEPWGSGTLGSDSIDLGNPMVYVLANIRPKRHKPIETTVIMLQLVASGRDVPVLPR